MAGLVDAPLGRIAGPIDAPLGGVTRLVDTDVGVTEQPLDASGQEAVVRAGGHSLDG